MKKFLSFIIITISGALLTIGIFLFLRFQNNPQQIVPYPYTFEKEAPSFNVDAPILIVGDRMGEYLAKFNEELAQMISVNLTKPIKVQSIAKTGNALHRTLHELKSINQWPQILIYQGGSEEFNEKKFDQREIKKIKTNFKLFKDERIETLLILFPILSRFLYEPVNQIVLPEILTPKSDKETEEDYFQKLDMELLLFEEQLIQLASLSKNRGSLLILTTTPLNLDVAPRKICDFTTTDELNSEMVEIKQLIEENPKTAYSITSKLLAKNIAHPELLYLHGQAAKKIGLPGEAIRNLVKSSAYDCSPWRTTEVQNSIIRKVANDQQILLFDFAQLVQNDYLNGPTFFDEIFPQNLYYEKGMAQLGLVIRNILKL